jgi:hypothetical protein
MLRIHTARKLLKFPMIVSRFLPTFRDKRAPLHLKPTWWYQLSDALVVVVKGMHSMLWLCAVQYIIPISESTYFSKFSTIYVHFGWLYICYRFTRVYEDTKYAWLRKLILLKGAMIQTRKLDVDIFGIFKFPVYYKYSKFYFLLVTIYKIPIFMYIVANLAGHGAFICLAISYMETDFFQLRIYAVSGKWLHYTLCISLFYHKTYSIFLVCLATTILHLA